MEKKERTTRDRTVVFVLLRGERVAAWSGADLALLCSNMCLICLFTTEYFLTDLLNWILGCKAVSCFWEADGEMLGGSARGELYPAVYFLPETHL